MYLYTKSPGVGVGVGEAGCTVNLIELSLTDLERPSGVNRIIMTCSPTDNPSNVVPVEPLDETFSY